MSKRVVLTFEVSFMSVTCLDLISCVSPSLVLQWGHRFMFNSLILSILSGIWRAYPLCPLGAPIGFAVFEESALIFNVFLKFEKVKACFDLNSSNSFFISSNSSLTFFSSRFSFSFSSSKSFIFLSLLSIIFLEELSLLFFLSTQLEHRHVRYCRFY